MDYYSCYMRTTIPIPALSCSEALETEDLARAVEELVLEAKNEGASFDEILSAVVSWGLQQLHSGEEFSATKLAFLRAFELSLAQQFNIKKPLNTYFQ